MRLTKWYMDFVSDDGRAWLGYAARLHYRGISLGYSALLNGSIDQPFEQRYCLKAQLPQWRQNQLHWQAAAFDCEARWFCCDSVTAAPVSLWESTAGTASWHNLLPRARVEMTHRGSRTGGTGYAECLTLTVPPWKLPLRRLRWGRFVAVRLSLVWIEWHLRDGGRRCWLFEEGRACDGGVVDEQGIKWPHGRLRIAPGSPIRRGRLRKMAFAETPLLRALLPRRVKDIDEYKRFAPASVELHTGEIHQGWVIDETVVFP